MAEARINREYLFRMCGVALFMAAICVWSLYDGYAAWPRKNLDFEKVRPALLATNLSARAWISAAPGGGESPLDRIFAAQNLKTPDKLIRRINNSKMPENLPKEKAAAYREREGKTVRAIFEEPLYSPGDLKGQFVMAVITAVASLLVFLSLFPKIGRVYRADDTGVQCGALGPDAIGYDEIRSMDWKLWDKKGIVKVIFRDGSQHSLDCWHFKGMREIVESIVAHRPDLAGEKSGDD